MELKEHQMFSVQGIEIQTDGMLRDSKKAQKRSTIRDRQMFFGVITVIQNSHTKIGGIMGKAYGVHKVEHTN